MTDFLINLSCIFFKNYLHKKMKFEIKSSNNIELSVQKAIVNTTLVLLENCERIYIWNAVFYNYSGEFIKVL